MKHRLLSSTRPPLSKPDNTGRYGLFLENLVIFFYHFLLDVAFSDVKITLSGNTAEIQGDKLIKLTKEVCNKITEMSFFHLSSVFWIFLYIFFNSTRKRKKKSSVLNLILVKLCS